MSKLLAAALVASAAAQTAWYAEYDLNATNIDFLIDEGCFRGQFHDGMSLVTCAQSENAMPIALLDDAARLCVVELRESSSMADVEKLLRGHLPLFAEKTHVILHNHATPDDFHEFCSDSYWHALADNVVTAATTPIIAQEPMPFNHRAVRRALLNRDILRVDPFIKEIVDSYSKGNVTNYVKAFSTDYQGASTKITRNSYSIQSGRGGCADNTWRCAHNIVDEVEAEINNIMKDYSADWEVERVQFRDTMCSNLVVKISGAITPDEVVIIGAHMDSRNTGSGSTASGPAPGADDNGTGSAVMLAMLKNMAEQDIEYTYSVHLQWYCGEEQGLFGSDFMARQYKADGVKVIGMFNNDMIGYTSPDHGMTLSFMNRNSEQWLTNACKAFANVYVPDLKVGDAGACCSDQQSWYAQGFPAAGIFETPTTTILYPQYHKTGDTWDNGLVNMEQVYRFGQANYCCILEFAVPLEDSRT